MEKATSRQINVKFPADEAQRVEAIAKALRLNISEIVRRATMEGLAAFKDARLPGSRSAAERDVRS